MRLLRIRRTYPPFYRTQGKLESRFLRKLYVNKINDIQTKNIDLHRNKLNKCFRKSTEFIRKHCCRTVNVVQIIIIIIFIQII